MMRRKNLGLAVGLSLLLAHSVVVAQPQPPVAAAPDAPVVPPAPPPAVPPAPAPAPAPVDASAPAPVPAATSAAATSSEAEPTKDEKKDATPTASASAYVIPDAPAFTILNVTPETIDRPASITKLGASLANVVTDKGIVRSGVALEVSMRGLGLLDKSSHHAYATDFWTRLFARTALSLGTVSDSATALLPAQTRLGFGLRVVLIDESDPLLDAAYQAETDAVIPICAKKAAGDVAQEFACRAKAYSDMPNKPGTVRWNNGGLSLGVAQSLAFAEARVKDGEADQFGAWVAAAFGASDCFQQAFGGKYVRDFRADAHNVTLSERSRLGGEKFRGSLEVAYTFNKPKDQDAPLAQATLGTEIKLSEAIWLSANVGGAINDASDVASLFALSNIKWNFETKPSWQVSTQQ